MSGAQETRQAITVKSVEDYKGSYVGENAYGAKRNILKIDRNVYSLVFKNPEDFGIAREQLITEVAIEVPMDVDTAKTAKANLRILLLYRLVSPFTEEKRDHIFPTVDYPRDGENNHHYLNAHVEEIWFYNSETGDIYSKMKAAHK